MPVVRIDMYQGKSKEYKKAILDGVHAALVKAFQIPEYDRNQMLFELPADNFERSDNKSQNFTVIEITAFKGRSYQAKKLLYTELTGNLSKNPGIEGGDVLIILNEQPLENWGIRGGKPADSVDLGFDVNV